MQTINNNKRKTLHVLFVLALSLLVIPAAGCAPSGDVKESEPAGKTEGSEASADSAQRDSAVGKGSSDSLSDRSSDGSSEGAAAVNTGTDAQSAAAGTGASSQSAAAGTGRSSEFAAVPGKGDYKAVIVIDPGHQGQGNSEQEPVGPGSSETKMKVSWGTSGVSTGVPEYQLTLDISLGLRDELEKRGYKVILTRESNDVNISNAERASIANALQADAFVRLHANGVGDQGHSGAMAICQTPWNVYNADQYSESRALADCILQAYVRETGINYEYVWETDTMSGINWSQVPVTILEMGYMTNPEEDRSMQDPEMQKKMVEGIADGIDEYIDRGRENENPDSGGVDEAAEGSGENENPDSGGVDEAAEGSGENENPDSGGVDEAAEGSGENENPDSGREDEAEEGSGENVNIDFSRENETIENSREDGDEQRQGGENESERSE